MNARVFTNQMWTDGLRTKTNLKTSPEQSGKLPHPPGSHFNCYMPPYRGHNKTNIFTKFHDDWANNETNVLTKFHETWAKHVTSRVFTCFHCIQKKKKNAPPTGGHVFSPIWTIFQLVRHINKTDVLINFHGEWAKIVTSRVFTMKTAPPTGGHVFQQTGTTFELNQHINIIGSNLLTKFHEDQTINVASRVFTNKCGRTDGRRTKTGHKSSPEQSEDSALDYSSA
ncbi:hypothetical protein DPMN_047492 [Dreissena polymorpha]|uniref:Uncharacterized protein n=1 Tax=Dreissena polymorpha TaxID=45954 RepID=A0A9D4DAG2_DREPO|nr:hypothetical protein DPMN_047492 [Dreissena polymorpha]